MKQALIGYTGFVGSNILSKHNFNNLYDIKNIKDIQDKKFDLVVCAAAPGIKWKANKFPKKDLSVINFLIENLKRIKSKRVILISTIDVYPDVDKVNEDTEIKREKLLPYGKHRRILEEFIESNFNSIIIRLPGLFGKGLKGNILYDLINKKYEFIPMKGKMQFYYLEHIWKDIIVTLDNKLEIVNFATEPISVEILIKQVFKLQYHKIMKNENPYYDMRTNYGYLWGKENSYIYSKFEVINDIKIFLKKYIL